MRSAIQAKIVQPHLYVTSANICGVKSGKAIAMRFPNERRSVRNCNTGHINSSYGADFGLRGQKMRKGHN